MTRALVAVLSLLALASGCSADPGDSSGPAGQGTLTVFAAASLKASFTELGEQFEAENEGVTIRFSFAGSSDLLAQLKQGAPADVFASADTVNMDKAVAEDLVAGDPVSFATNTLQIVTPADNPARVESLGDLASPGIKVVLCAQQVPCGSAAAKIQSTAGIDIVPVSEEQSVTDVLGKVISGEADAGLVYTTDVRSAGEKVNGVDLAEAAEAVNTYPIAALNGKGLAERFIGFVTGPEGQAVLTAAGFGRP